MLKITNKTGKTVMVLKDDANEPEDLEKDKKVDEESNKTKLKKTKTDKEKGEESEI